MDLGLAGRTAVVAASSRGLGRAVAESLAREGANLVLCARTAAPLENAAGAIRRAHGVEVLARPTDVTREEDVRALVDAARSRFGRIDVLVANAGGPPAGGFLDAPAVRHALELNLLSTFLLARAVVPSMQERGWGRIVVVASVSVKQPIDGLILSNISRLGVLGLSKTMATDLAKDGILVNVVCPGYTRTERLEELRSASARRESVGEDEIVRRWTAAIPLGRLGEPAEFGDFVAFLCSERASYVTGTCIPVDGGFVRSAF